MIAAAASTPRAGEVVASKYEVLRLLGKGRSGRVYLARHLVTDREVVLKWMIHREDTDADDVERFIREARAAARVAHPHVVDIFDVGQAHGSVFLVMEYLEGVPFSELVADAPLRAGPTLRLLLPAMRALHAAHQAGVIHRDIKPHNLFALHDEAGVPWTSKVLDFGIAKQLDADEAASLTQTGVVMGSPHYMAPEQAEDARAVDARADVYAMGVTLYQALSGELPYQAGSLPGLLLRITRGDAAGLETRRPDLPPALCASVMRAMAVDPARRFASMCALADALQPFATDERLTTAGDTPQPTASTAAADPLSAQRRRRWAWSLALLWVLAAVGAPGWWALGPGGGWSTQTRAQPREPAGNRLGLEDELQTQDTSSTRRRRSPP